VHFGGGDIVLLYDSLKFKEETGGMYSWKVNQKYFGSCEMWSWMDGEDQTELVKNEAILHRVKGERNILHTAQRRKATWIGHILHWNFPLKHVIEG
jgi:hypothetical protein